MSESRERMIAEYAELLDAFVGGAGETASTRAYGIGREAVNAKLGLLGVLEIHQNALAARVGTISPESARVISAATELLFALLAPYEMTQRGYQDSVAELLGLNRELTDRSAKLAAANRELEAFSYTISHDLRAPLRSISGFSAMLVEDYGEALGEEGRRRLDRISAGIRRMDGLIGDLLNLSRISRAQLKVEPVDLTLHATAIAEELRQREPERAVSFAIEEGLHTRADVGLVRAALENLFANAWKFTRRRPDARIEFGRTDGASPTVFFVRDNGVGFDPAVAERIFEPFERFHSERDFEGTGIGLATVRRVVERHGGRVRAEGRPGEGATIFFTLEGTEGGKNGGR